MKKHKEYLKIILGTFIIGATLELFFVNFDLVPNGIFGFAALYSEKVGLNIALVTLLANIFFLLLGKLVLPNKFIKNSVLSFLLVPLFMYITSFIVPYIDLASADMLLISIFAGALLGIGYKCIYTENRYTNGIDIMELISSEITKEYSSYTKYIFDIIWVIFSVIIYGFTLSLYTIIALCITEFLCKRTIVGVSTSKVFYIITKEEAKVKQYIINELHCNLTEFDVKGGYSKNKNRVIMCVVPTDRYYKLREGIKNIDESAFISITDSYEVINQDLSVKDI